MYHLIKALYLHATSLPEYSILLLGLDGAGKTTLLNQIKNMYGGNTSSGGAGESRLAAGSTGDGAPSEAAGRTVPTVGQNVCTIQLPHAYLRLWDIGGQQALRSLWSKYYASCHAIVFVVDSTDVGDANLAHLRALADGGAGSTRPSTTSSLRPTLAAVDPTAPFGRLEECAAVLRGVLGDAGAAGVPLLVLANKQDREDSVEVVRIKEGFVRRVVEGEDAGGRRRRRRSGDDDVDGLDDEEAARGDEGDVEAAAAREQAGYVRDSRVLPCSALHGTGVREAVDWVSTRVGWNKEARPPVMR